MPVFPLDPLKPSAPPLDDRLLYSPLCDKFLPVRYNLLLYRPFFLHLLALLLTPLVICHLGLNFHLAVELCFCDTFVPDRVTFLLDGVEDTTQVGQPVWVDCRHSRDVDL